MRGEADQPGFCSELQRTHGSLTNPHTPPFQVTAKIERGIAPDTKAEAEAESSLLEEFSPVPPHHLPPLSNAFLLLTLH